MHLVVGLGNPGKEYSSTRHNVGFDVVDALAIKFGWATAKNPFDAQSRSKFDGMVMDGLVDGRKLILLKPMTYMNDSGRSVLAATQFYQASTSDMLVVLDDLALPVGKLRLRAGGSSGGHNGLRDLERVLGTQDYGRLRLGIDPKPPYVPQADYVLSRFSPEQRRLVDSAIGRCCEAVLTWMRDGIEKAMNRFNADAE